MPQQTSLRCFNGAGEQVSNEPNEPPGELTVNSRLAWQRAAFRPASLTSILVLSASFAKGELVILKT